MGRQCQAFSATKQVAELQRRSRAVDRLGQERRVGKAHVNLAGEGRNGRVGTVDLCIGSDGFDPVEVVGIGDIGGNDVAQRHPVALDRPVEMAEALQGNSRGRPRRRGRGNGLALCEQHGLCCEEARPFHGPQQSIKDAARIHGKARHFRHADFDGHAGRGPVARHEGMSVQPAAQRGTGHRAIRGRRDRRRQCEIVPGAAEGVEHQGQRGGRASVGGYRHTRGDAGVQPYCQCGHGGGEVGTDVDLVARRAGGHEDESRAVDRQGAVHARLR